MLGVLYCLGRCEAPLVLGYRTGYLICFPQQGLYEEVLDAQPLDVLVVGIYPGSHIVGYDQEQVVGLLVELAELFALGYHVEDSQVVVGVDVRDEDNFERQECLVDFVVPKVVEHLVVSAFSAVHHYAVVLVHLQEDGTHVAVGGRLHRPSPEEYHSGIHLLEVPLGLGVRHLLPNLLDMSHLGTDLHLLLGLGCELAVSPVFEGSNNHLIITLVKLDILI